MREIIKSNLEEAQAVLAANLADERVLSAIDDAGRLLAQRFEAGARVISCGNGGSHCDAMHFAEELSGRFRDDRLPLAAMAISDPAHISCTANDYGYDQVFSRFVAAHGRNGDVLLAISTSGTSANIVKAAEVARERGVHVIALTGKAACTLADHSDIVIATQGGAYADRVQEMHIKVIHTLIEIVERTLFPGNY